MLQIQAKTFKSGREYFRLVADSYSSDASEKKEKSTPKKSVSTFGRFRLWTSFECSPVSINNLDSNHSLNLESKFQLEF